MENRKGGGVISVSVFDVERGMRDDGRVSYYGRFDYLDGFLVVVLIGRTVTSRVDAKFFNWSS